MLEKLNQTQIEGMAVIRDEFLAKGLSTFQVNEGPELTERFNRLYECGGLPKPKYGVILVDSPMAIQNKYTELTGDDSSMLSHMGFGSLDAGWLSFYEFFRRYAADEVKGMESIDGLVGLVGIVSYYLPLENVVIASRNPVSINMVDGRAHNLEGPAWVYADGFKGYSFFGTPVSEETFNAVKAGDANKILAITNAEERLVAMKAAGPENMLKALKSNVVDTKGDEYTLFEVTIEGEQHKLLKMRNPSEPKDHYEFVPPEVKTVSMALAWRIGWEEFQEPVAKT